MQQPTKERILEAARTSLEAKKAIEKIFPELFERVIKLGDIFSWGTDNNGGSGMVMEHPSQLYFTFTNFRNGRPYLRQVNIGSTPSDLKRLLGKLSAKKLHNCYNGELNGPYKLSFWSTKRRCL